MKPQPDHPTRRRCALGALALLILVSGAGSSLALDGVKSVKITNTRDDWFYIEELQILNDAAVDVASTAFGTTATATSAPGFGSNINGPIDDVFGNCCGTGWHSSEQIAEHVYTITFPAAQTLEGDITMWNRQDGCCPERMDGMLFEFFGGDDGAGVFLGEFDANGLGLDAGDADGASFPVPFPLDDSDGDGLPDAWEDAHGLDPDDDGKDPNNNGVPGDPANGADGDPDMDALLNIDEFINRADPQDPDSDDDTLEDGAEVSGAGTRPPTDPDEADTDGDGITDDIESNTGVFVGAADTGTDPTLADTDMDNTDDGEELVRGSDPTDPNSGGNLSVGKPVSFFDAANNPTGAWGGLPATNIVDGLLNTIGHPLDQASADYYCEIDLGEEFAIGTVELTGRGFRDNCCPERLEEATLVILDGALNAVLSQVVPGQVIMTEVVDFSAAPPVGRYVRVVNTSGADYGPQLGELAVFGSVGPIAPFEITAVSVTPATGSVSLTFNSAPGAEYSLFASSTAGEGLWEELNDAVPSDGAETTIEFTDTEGAGQPRRLYRLQRN